MTVGAGAADVVVVSSILMHIDDFILLTIYSAVVFVALKQFCL